MLDAFARIRIEVESYVYWVTQHLVLPKLRARTPVQALVFVVLFFSILNMAYTFAVVVVARSWLLTWRLDRRFPFNMIPLWAFFLVSLAASGVSLYYYPKNHPKLGCDRVNRFLVCLVIGLTAWIIFSLSLIHTSYIGDFYVGGIIKNIFSGRSLLELPRQDIDIVPTLGDTVFIAYALSFLFLYLASWRAFRAVDQNTQMLTTIGSHTIIIGKIRD